MSNIPTGGSSLPQQTGDVTVPYGTTSQTGTGNVSQKDADQEEVSQSAVHDTALSYLKSKNRVQNLSEKARTQEEALNSSMENRPNLDAYSNSMKASPFSMKTLESISEFFNGPSSKTTSLDNMAFLPNEDVETETNPNSSSSTTSSNNAAFYLSGTGGWMVAINKATLESQSEQRESSEVMNKLVANAQNSSRELTFDSYNRQMDAAQKEMVVSAVSSSAEMFAGAISIGGAAISVAQKSYNSPEELKQVDQQISELDTKMKAYDGDPTNSKYLQDKETLQSGTPEEIEGAQKRLDERSSQSLEQQKLLAKKNQIETNKMQTDSNSIQIINAVSSGIGSIVSAGGKLSTAFTEKKAKEDRAMADLDKQSKNVQDQTSQQIQKAMQAALEMNSSANQLMVSVGQVRQSAVR